VGMEDREVRAGQVWKRKRDGVETVIVSASSGTGLHPTVRHRISRKLWDTDRGKFLERYELQGDTETQKKPPRSPGEG